MAKRQSLGLDDDTDTEDQGVESIDIAALASPPSTSKPDKSVVARMQKEGEKLGFVSRAAKKKPRQSSPYVIQHNTKLRAGMKELLADVTLSINSHSDQETFELALLALIEKHGLSDLMAEYKKLVK